MAKRYPTKEYEIWIGYYHLGQGHEPPTEPQMVGKITAPNFRVACLLYELRGRLKSIEGMIEKDEYIQHQSCRWFYDFEQNRNSWTGKYFENKEDATTSFSSV